MSFIDYIGEQNKKKEMLSANLPHQDQRKFQSILDRLLHLGKPAILVGLKKWR